MVVGMHVRVEQLRTAILGAVQQEVSVEPTVWGARVSVPRPDTDHPGWPALLSALRASGGRWGVRATAEESTVWVELVDGDDG